MSAKKHNWTNSSRKAAEQTFIDASENMRQTRLQEIHQAVSSGAAAARRARSPFKSPFWFRASLSLLRS